MATMHEVEAFDESLFLIDVEVSSGLTKTLSSGAFGLLPGAEVVLHTGTVSTVVRVIPARLKAYGYASSRWYTVRLSPGVDVTTLAANFISALDINVQTAEHATPPAVQHATPTVCENGQTPFVSLHAILALTPCVSAMLRPARIRRQS
jgi:hypothetical protein